jgi:hypothetical protein
VLGSGLAAEPAVLLADRLRKLFAHPETLEMLATIFDVNGFDRPPPQTYQPLLGLL